jgi:methionyl aminopeptidase
MVLLKTEEEIELIRKSAEVLSQAHGEVAKMIRPGIKTKALDTTAEMFIRDHHGIPSFKGFNGFPSSLCISVNETVVHGFPGDYELNEGDIISVDCGVLLNGFHSDCAYTYPVGEVKEEVRLLLQRTKESLYKGIEQARYGQRIGDVSYAIQQFVEQFDYGIVRELVGHGLGRDLHEPPEVPNYGKRGKGVKLKDGLVLAIEPMINLGKRGVVQGDDGWTIKTVDGQPSAHFEHTVAVRKTGTEILTSHSYIEDVLNGK